MTGTEDNEHPVLPFGSVQPVPLTYAVPETDPPVPVDPEIDRVLTLLEENNPPDHPEGAESTVMPPVVIDVGVAVTFPV